MAEFEATVVSARSLADTFAYMADFRNVSQWDPAIVSSELSSGQAGEIGATYDVTLTMAGKETTIPYTATEVQAPVRLVMRGETDALVSLDTISVAEAGGKVEVTYHAALELKGVRKVADPVAGLALSRDGEKAAEGLAERLAG